MKSLTASDVRNDFSTTINEVAFGGERVEVVRSGKAIAAIISREDLALLEAIEDKIDGEAALKALANADFLSLEDAKAELEL